MAQVNISYDTENAELSVNIDGQRVENVDDVDIMVFREGDGHISLRVNNGEQNGLTSVTRIVGHEDDDAVKASASGKVKYVSEDKTLVEVKDKTNLSKAAYAFLGKNYKK